MSQTEPCMDLDKITLEDIRTLPLDHRDDVETCVRLAIEQWPDWEYGEAYSDLSAGIVLRDFFSLKDRGNSHTDDADGIYAINWITARLFDYKQPFPDSYGEIVGFAGWNRAPFATNMYELSGALVAEPYRKKGIGELLLKARLAAISDHARGKSSWDIIVRTWDNPMYRKHGFVPGFQEALQHHEGKCLMLAHCTQPFELIHPY